MLRVIIFSSFLVIALSAHAQSIDEYPVLVEGHVFNLRTGTPIRNALVCPIPSTACGEVTDENGFFSLIMDLSGHDFLIAECRFESRGKPERTYRSESVLPHLFRPRDGTPILVIEYLRRDFYLDVQRSSGQVHCHGSPV
jgi:hypothetical protein